jgi:deoxyribonuclease (pyrimidine dimer)
MTRVNLIDPTLLTDQHLIAERLELTWIPGSAIRSWNSKNGIQVHPNYVLGTGHVSFFHNKIGYLKKRFDLITKEMIRRGFSPKMPWPVMDIPHVLMQDYLPTKDDYKIIIERIIQRIDLKPQWYRYEGKQIPNDFLRRYENYGK